MEWITSPPIGLALTTFIASSEVTNGAWADTCSVNGWGLCRTRSRMIHRGLVETDVVRRDRSRGGSERDSGEKAVVTSNQESFTDQFNESGGQHVG